MSIKQLWQAEPAAILGFVNAVIALAVGFGLNLTPEQTGLILAVVSAGIGLLTRSQVYAPDTVAKLLREDTPRG